MDKSIRITVVIPCRVGESAQTTLDSLALQTYQGFKTIVIEDLLRKGASYVRNKGFEHVDTEFVLFSDNDIEWKPNALEVMIKLLDRFSGPSYCYGRYKLGKNVWSHQPFWADLLKHHNYISTMSLMRAKDFPGFDETLIRLQDWDLYLNLLINHNKRGIYCEELVFETKIKPGITFNEQLNSSDTYLEAERIVKKKYGLNEFTPPLPKR